MPNKYDIIILGGGNAGFGVSAIAHEAGKKIAFVENWDFGGTCPNRGCTPKKFLVSAGQALHDIERASFHHIDGLSPKLDWAKLIQRKKEAIDFLPEAMAGLAAKRGDVFTQAGKFVGPNSIQVGDQILEAENIVIATGSKTRPLPIPGAEHMITSDEVMLEEKQPGEIVFIGGGVIAMEFSHLYARAGTKVTILEAMPQLLPRIDTDAVAVIQKESERIGITVDTNVQVKDISFKDGKFHVCYEAGGEVQTIAADKVVNGTGRIANVEGLDLDAGNIKHDRISIAVDEHLRSVSNPSVWVAGDALTTSPQLAPLATYEGRIVGQNIVEGLKHKPDYATIPNTIFTVPTLSSLGLTEAEAQQKKIKVAVSVNDMTDWFTGKSYAESAAWSKILVDTKKDRIVGAHLVGHHGEEIINLFALAMRHDIPASQLKEGIYSYPTFSYDVKSMF
ncbi:MAG: NAD(P)/FAD-dependent oxidoreductase [Halopseudomonas aestusnigri]